MAKVSGSWIKALDRSCSESGSLAKLAVVVACIACIACVECVGVVGSEDAYLVCEERFADPLKASVLIHVNPPSKSPTLSKM